MFDAGKYKKKIVTLLPFLVVGSFFCSPWVHAGTSVCAARIQDRIAWDYNGSKHWDQNNIDSLCRGAEQSTQPAICFEKVMHGGVNWGGGTKWQWQNAVDLCKATTNANATIHCFQGEIKAGKSWKDGITQCARPLTVKQVALPPKVGNVAYDKDWVPPSTLLFKRDLNHKGKPLKGFVDLHTHPMSYLGFGGHLVHGAPDIGALMPAGQIYDPSGNLIQGTNCNNSDRIAGNVEEALGSCKATHGGFNADGNKCGNDIRRFVLSQLEDSHNTNHPHDVEQPDGYPTFSRWPKYNDILHQQMWVDWIKRAHDGGMRVLVTLAVNSVTLAKGIAGNAPYDDKSSGDKEISEMKRFVSRHRDWMEIAYSSRDLRRIVEQDKLAIIIGVELDDIGSFLYRAGGARSAPTPGEVKKEIDRLYSSGVRYIFPVHLIDNFFGGTASYDSDTAVANRAQFGSFWKLRCSTTSEHITQKIQNAWDSPFKGLLSGIGTDTQPIPNCQPGAGHVNTRGLQELGKVAIREMMSKGMLIDVDHMSQKTVQGVLSFAPSYPFFSGHNGPRGMLGAGNENQRTDTQYQTLANHGGVAGVGWGESNAKQFIQRARKVMSFGLPVNLGSDIDGLVIQPGPPEAGTGSRITYGPSFPMARMGSRTWDYNKEGVAHIGLFPDFLRDVELSGGRDVVNKLFDGAEGVAKAWEKAETVSRLASAVPYKFGKIIMIVRTTTDDIRGSVMGSAPARAWIRVNLRDRSLPEVEVTNMPKGANVTANFTLATGRPIAVTDVKSVTIRHQSNDCFGCARDYWKAIVRLEGDGGQFILQTPEFTVGHESKTYPRR